MRAPSATLVLDWVRAWRACGLGLDQGRESHVALCESGLGAHMTAPVPATTSLAELCYAVASRVSLSVLSSEPSPLGRRSAPSSSSPKVVGTTFGPIVQGASLAPAALLWRAPATRSGKLPLEDFTLDEPGWIILAGVFPHRVGLSLQWLDSLAEGHMHDVLERHRLVV